ncbi:hypothetical protein G7084_03430 [Weissella coleopterorum]|uniref:Uncharacterized protein n=1 Tax=Weissella coleopterorum TaxID=2714949 RepID=A0A6G8AZR2_9LACO|nr:hypothetical protein [Weissella coleopterorum]QIL50452.1 hypothetical protein G7084_03430 [Weissella coleopterorum]
MIRLVTRIQVVTQVGIQVANLHQSQERHQVVIRLLIQAQIVIHTGIH